MCRIASVTFSMDRCLQESVINVLVMIIVFILAHVILSKTRTGDYLYAVGGNEEAAKLSGVNVIKTKYIAYIACGVCTAVAGLIMLASLGSAEAVCRYRI